MQSVLEERWPALARRILEAKPPPSVRRLAHGGTRTLLIGGIQLTSARDRRAEARLQASLIPSDASVATVYGLALGDLPRELLGREELRELRVVVLNLGLARLALASGDSLTVGGALEARDRLEAGDWLADPRVELIDGSLEERVHAPFAACPASLRLADEACARLRDQVHLELATPFIRRRLRAREGELARQLQQNEERVQRDARVSSLFGSRQGANLHLAAAGPTLSRSFDLLRERPAAEPLIAVDAALAPLLAQGIVPDFVVCVDASRKGILPYFSGELAACRAATLVYLPVVHADVLERWPGRRLLALSRDARYSALAQAAPQDVLFVSGSVLHPAVDLAVRLGARTVELHGVDLCFPAGQSHVAGAAHAHEVADWMQRGVWVLDGNGERVPTLPNLRGYLRDLEAFLERHPEVAFSKRCREGARIEGVAYREEEATHA